MNNTAMNDTATSYAHEYATAIMARNRVPMPPAGFVPDWSDRPRMTKYYPDTLSVPLPDAPPPHSVAEGIAEDTGDEPFTLPLLGGMLRDSYGLVGRRLAIQGNTDVTGFPSYPRACWHRGTASGGGLYPCSIYWIAGPGAGVTPGVYYYGTAQHRMQRLLAGDVTGRVRAALGEGLTATQFLVIGVKYWANSFKYNSFSYHAVSMDVGTVLQTWRLWAGGQGRRIEPRFWFDQEPLQRLLGLEPDAEGLFAVVPLAWDTPAPAPVTPPEGVAVRHRDREQSRTIIEFEAVARMNRLTGEAAPHRPAPGVAAAAAVTTGAGTGERIRLPEPKPLTMPMRTALRRRRSSFGRFDASTPLAAADLAALLTATHAARLPTDIDGPDDGDLVKYYVFANHVRDVPDGSYEYDPATGDLCGIRPGPTGTFLQRNYFLPNYNLEQAAVVIVPTIRVHALLTAAGPRAYHLAGAAVGALAQNFYTAAAALDVGCGVALGFDNVSHAEELGLDGTEEIPMLIMMAGHERRLVADYRYELAGGER